MDAVQVSNLGFTADYPFEAFRVMGSHVDGRMDTDLRINSPGFVEQHLFGSSLLLGLGCRSSSSDSKGSSAAAYTIMSSNKAVDKGSTMDLNLDFALRVGSTAKGVQYPSVVDLELSLSTRLFESGVTTGIGLEIPLLVGGRLSTEEGSMPCQGKLGTITMPPHCSFDQSDSFLDPTSVAIDSIPILPDLSSSETASPNSSITCTSGTPKKLPSQYRGSVKTCQVEGCVKGARGASGRCISHGGGRRCQKSGCHKGAEGRTVFCKSHGGGRRCEFLGCTKSAEGSTDYCIGHGGGRRCGHEGCDRAARGKSGLCIRHGGGKRCRQENCTKSAEGLSGLCILHGGGRRCQYAAGCTKGAQGSTMFCKAHGGGKRCTFAGCTKGAEGSTPFCKGHGGGKRCTFQGGGICTKSVHGGTAFCVVHGGGKRCAAPGCPTSARGRTNHCVRHGGGKRCQFPTCSKSAQGSTDFCKAHGGGKRKMGHQSLQGSLIQDKRVHGGGILGGIVQRSSTSGEATTSLSMSCPIFSSSQNSVPEGRVHGGSLMAILASGDKGMFPNAMTQIMAVPPSYV